MKIAHNRKWRSATSLVEGLHYFFALFLEEKQQFITTRRGEKKMPQNKRESLIYTFIMCFMMVFWMSIYNVSLHMGGLSMESIKAGWLGFPIAYIFAMCCDWFFVSKIAKGFAFKYLVKPDSSVFKKSYFSILLYGCTYGDHYVTLWSSRSLVSRWGISQTY